ncbi:MAG: hypothetical protein LBF58_06215 [Deltaproteobacteria bacterium]|jgi:hypothetical protein|nr:hypothetical protein [Deltaproteobacteria bacterium]
MGIFQAANGLCGSGWFMIKVLLIDELLEAEVNKAREYLNINTVKSPINDLFWLELPDDILDNDQKNYVKNNNQLKIAIEVGKTWVRFELLIRSESLTNVGGGELNEKQIKFMLIFYNEIINYIKG